MPIAHVYHDLAMMVLIAHDQQLYGEDDITELVKALDSTTIDLCVSLFLRAPFHSRKAAIKLHTIMDLQGAIPAFIHISNGKIHGVNTLDMIPIMAVRIYIMDRGYVDFERLYNLHTCGDRFVIRVKKKLRFYQITSTPIDTTIGLQCAQIIQLTVPKSKRHYPHPLGRVHLIDRENKHNIDLLTNIIDCDAKQIAAYYKNRWQIELFFKWIKQRLRIKAFYGQSINTIKTQIWTTICYLNLVITHKIHDFDISLHTMIQVISVAILERMAHKQLFF